MSRAIVLDTGTLGMLTHPRDAVRRPVVAWYRECLLAGAAMVVPEIADYELRRELLRALKQAGLSRLDEIAASAFYLPITTAVMREAARLWAHTRNQGLPLTPPEALDADVILAAQAQSLEGRFDEVVVATDNVGHLAHLVTARTWDRI